MESLKLTIDKHPVSVVCIATALFFAFGLVYAASAAEINCGLGSRNDDTTLNETMKRSDDASFFAKMVCVGQKPKHNR